MITMNWALWLGAILSTTSTVEAVYPGESSCPAYSRRYVPGMYRSSRSSRFSPYSLARNNRYTCDVTDTTSGISGVLSRYYERSRRHHRQYSGRNYRSDNSNNLPSFDHQPSLTSALPNLNRSVVSSGIFGRAASAISDLIRESPRHICSSCSQNCTSNRPEPGGGGRRYDVTGETSQVRNEAETHRLVSRCVPTEGSVYDFKVTDGRGKTRKLKSRRYRGKVLLIVVTATFHPLSTQLLELNTLQEKYDGGLKILAFPCNQFRVTENGGNHTEIMNIMYYVRPGNGFTPLFEVFSLTPVNGAAEAPLFTYLKAACPPTRSDYLAPPTDLKYDPLRNSDVREPYEKFLVSGQGAVVARYDARLRPHQVEEDVVAELMRLGDEGEDY